MPRGKHREVLVEEGLRLIQENGFEATGVQEITNASGVPKGSFYNYFKSKEDFGVEVLGVYGQQAAEQVRNRLAAGDGSPLDRLNALFASWIEDLGVMGYEQGCLAGQLCQEMAGKSPMFQGAVDGLFNQLETEFTRCLREAQSVGELAEDADVEALGSFVYNCWQGAVLRMKATQSPVPLEQCRRMIFEAILVKLPSEAS